MLASISHEIWQLYICIGILTGFASSLMWYPCMQRPLEWFSKHRSLATGIVLGAYGVGGLTYSNIMTACLETIGYAWCLRVVGFLQLVLGGIAAISCKPLNRPTKSVGIVDVSILHNKRLIMLLVAHFIAAFAFSIPGAFLAQYAVYLGVDNWSATNMNGVLSAGMSVGSIVLGYLGDYIGNFNMTILSGCFMCLVQLAIWLPASNSAGLWAFAVTVGVSLGGFTTLLIALIPDCVDSPSKVPAGTGWSLFMWLFGMLLGQPLASAIISRTDIPDYRGAIIFSAMLAFTASCIVLVMRVLHGGWKFFKKV
ncbi:MFS general substrate transporter [Lichtheimia hyalospora FSU 10163]|nr:MFS general substrate transporter [Lichtheimia hyalospora FSU 10163]